MSLKSSAYATMALREVLAHDTSSQSQAELSAAYHAKDAEETKQKKANDEKINNDTVNNDETKIKDESVIDEEKDKSCDVEKNLNKDEINDVEKNMDESAEPVVEPTDKQ